MIKDKEFVDQMIAHYYEHHELMERAIAARDEAAEAYHRKCCLEMEQYLPRRGAQ